MFLFNLLFHFCIFTAYRCGVALQGCKMAAHRCVFLPIITPPSGFYCPQGGGKLPFLCNFASHHCKTLLQSCKSVSHHCIGHCTAAKWPRTTAKRIYSIAKRPRTIAKRFCSIVSCPCSGAGRNCTAIPPARRAARVPRRPARRRVCGAGRASRSGGSIRGLPASASRGRRPRGGRG